jgi:hypothetical protein
MVAVLEEAERHSIIVHRISQGSGIMLQTDNEILEMARLGRENEMEVSLFVGPRAGWDIGAQMWSGAGKNLGARLRGMEQVVYALEDIKRGCALGLRSVLVADEGVLWMADEMKRAGHLPTDLILKVSVQMGAANPASVRWMERLGAGTYNTPTDLTLAQLAAIRQAVSIPLDVYVEVPDDFGGFVRLYEIPELVRVAAPVYLKFGLRNAPNYYPAGQHLEAQVMGQTRERVRRAALGLRLLHQYYPEATVSKRGAAGLGLPV